MYLKPPYADSRPNEDITLGQESVRLLVREKPLEGRASVSLRLIPSPRIEADVELSHAPPVLSLDNIDRQVQFPSIGAAANMLATKYRNGQVKLLLSGDAILRGDPRSRVITEVVCHLYNFPDFRGDVDRTVTENWARKDRVMLSSQGWSITIVPLVNTSCTMDILKESGGYGLTHVCLISRNGGQCFAFQKLQEVLVMLHHFLSFARGAWAAPLLSVGYDTEDRVVCEEWGARHCTPWRESLSWFDRMHGMLLAEVFPGFCARWEEPFWRKVCMEAVYWYIRSNTMPESDAGIVLNQIALESLSWAYCVETEHIVSRDGFNRLRAADQIRMLLSSLRIPTDIPETLTSTVARAKGLNWVDAPQVLAEVRNSLVHPKRAGAEDFHDVYYELKQLGLSFLELSLLRLCDYYGKYATRLVAGRYEGVVGDVPWVKGKS